MIQAGNRIVSNYKHPPRNVLCSKCIEFQEFLYGHWFDLELVNDDLAGCFESLVRAVRRLDQDAQWVPASWVQ